MKGRKKERAVPKTNVEIDVSGQLSADGDTVFAYSNDENYSILVKSSVKKEVKKQRLLSKKAPGRFYFDFYIGGLLVLFLRLHRHKGPIYLDWELFGRHTEVRGELLVRLRRRGVEVFTDILPKKVGKRSPAHLLAYSVFKKRKKPDRILTVGELLRLLK